jgi:hypothetical protein
MRPALLLCFTTTGARGGNRTPDLDVRTVLLYPLSYAGSANESKDEVEHAPCARPAPLSYAGSACSARQEY